VRIAEECTVISRDLEWSLKIGVQEVISSLAIDSGWITSYTEIDKTIDAWDMGPLGEPMAASRLGAGRLLFPIGWRENFGYKSLQRCGSGVPWGAWLERL
jgi:hypothetical protein